MQLHIHLKKDYLALRFASTADRDTFFAEMGKNPVNGYYIQNAAQRIGNRTIQISLSKVEFSHEWPVQFLPKRIKEIGDSVPIRVNTPAAAVATPQPEAPKPVFPEVKSPLDVVPAERQQLSQPVTASAVPPNPQPLESPKEAEAPAPVDDSDPKPVGVHHLSKEMREWKARQKSKQPVAA